jgi:hypothetical protein
MALPCNTWRHPVTAKRPDVGDDITDDLRKYLHMPIEDAGPPTTWTHELTLGGMDLNTTMSGLVDQMTVCTGAKHTTRWASAALLLSLAPQTDRDLWTRRVREGLRNYSRQLQESVDNSDAAIRVAQLAEQVYRNMNNPPLREALRTARSDVRADRQRARGSQHRMQKFLNTHFFKRVSDLCTGRAPTKERTAGGLEREERAMGNREIYNNLRREGASAMSDYMDGEDEEGDGLRWLYMPINEENMWAFLKASLSMNHADMHATSPFVDGVDIRQRQATNDTLMLDHVTSQSLLLIPSAQNHPLRPVNDTNPCGVLVPAVCHPETTTTMMVLPVAALGTNGFTFNARVHGVEHERLAVVRSMLTDTLLGKGTGLSTLHRAEVGDVGMEADSHEAAWGFIHLMLHTIRYLHLNIPVTHQVQADSDVAGIFRALWDTTLVAMGAGAECALTSLTDLSSHGRPSSVQCLSEHEWAMVDTLSICAYRAGMPAKDVCRRFAHFFSRRLHKMLVQPIVVLIEQTRTDARAMKRELSRKLESQRSTKSHRLFIAAAMRQALVGQPLGSDVRQAVGQCETDGTPTQRGRRRFWDMVLDDASDDQFLRGCGMTREECVRWRALRMLTRDLRDNLNCMKSDVRAPLAAAVVGMGGTEKDVWLRLTNKDWCHAATREARNECVASVSGPALGKIVREVDKWVTSNTPHPERRVPLQAWCWTEWGDDEMTATATTLKSSVVVATNASDTVSKTPLPQECIPMSIRPLMTDPGECDTLVQQALSTSSEPLRRMLERMGWTVETIARGVIDAATTAWNEPSGKMVGAWPCTEHAMIEHLCRDGELCV